MVSRRLLLGATIVCLLIGLAGLVFAARERLAQCAALPLLGENLLPNADLAAVEGDMPRGWERRAGGVQLGRFDLDGDGRALQLLGIANYVQTPPLAVQSGRSYCFVARAISDNGYGSTRLRLVFVWRDGDEAVLSEEATRWQPVVLWQADAPPAAWSSLAGASVAPERAATLVVRVQPAADERVYLDAMALRQGGAAIPAAPTPSARLPHVAPWPNGKQAAVAFTFDWETAMGGLVHSRSLGDPNSHEEPIARGLRMREGITQTLAIFQPYGVRATYYAVGYNFLTGNREQRRFMGDPTFPWATRANGWLSDEWATRPWFSADPYGTASSDPAWYFGDLIAPLQRAGHEIQSHTFSHFDGGKANPADWQADLAAWAQVAGERGVAPATAIAFPWSSSAGMGDSSWALIEAAGVRSVTRLSDQAQYDLFGHDKRGIVAAPRCQPLPAFPRLLACPDFYLTVAREEYAREQIDRALVARGMIDIWAHTEEVTSPAQIATWQRVVGYAAGNPALWVAPLGEIATWQQALAEVQIEALAPTSQDGQAVSHFKLRNGSDRPLVGLTIEFDAPPARVTIDGDEVPATALRERALLLDLAAGATVEVRSEKAEVRR